jgi:hypothetical protein
MWVPHPSPFLGEDGDFDFALEQPAFRGHHL